jgi:hypothetical protein
MWESRDLKADNSQTVLEEDWRTGDLGLVISQLNLDLQFRLPRRLGGGSSKNPCRSRLGKKKKIEHQCQQLEGRDVSRSFPKLTSRRHA